MTEERREPTVGALGLCGRTDDEELSLDAARWTPSPAPQEPLPWLHGGTRGPQ